MAAVALHHQRLALEAERAHASPKTLQVRADLHHDPGAEHGAEGPLPLADHGQHVDAGEHRNAVPQLLVRDLLSTPLVRRVEERPEEGDGDRLDPLVAQLPDRLADVLLLQRNDRVAGLIDPLAYRPPQVAVEQRPRRRRAKVPAVGLVALAEPQNITMPVGAEKARLRQASLDEDVGGGRGAVHEALARAEQRGEVGVELAGQHLEAVDHAVGRVFGGRHLGRPDRAPVGSDAVRVGSANVDGGDIGHGRLLVGRPQGAGGG